jgi:type II secretory pathway pseudopilin PulG
MNNRRAFSIIEIIIAISLTGFVFYLGSNWMRQMGKQQKHDEQLLSAERETHAITQLINLVFRGNSAFTNVTYRLPLTPELVCVRWGFCVKSNTWSDGSTTSEPFDTIYYLVSAPGPMEVKLSGTFSTGGLSLAVQNGTTPLNQIFSPGDFIVLSRIQTSDVLRVTAALPSTPSGTLATVAANFSHSLLAPTTTATLAREYRSGDMAMRAALKKLSVDGTTKDITESLWDGSKSRVLGQQARKFKVAYTVSPSALCPEITLAANTYSEDWSWFVANPSCYQRVATLRFSIQLASRSEIHEIRLQ